MMEAHVKPTQKTAARATFHFKKLKSNTILIERQL